MKKFLIVAAVFVLALGMIGSAQAGDVTIYGKLHMSVDYSDTDAAGGDPTTGVASNSSRIGFKGSEKVGDMTVLWKLESGLDASGEDTTLSIRERFLGLQGGFGTVKAGILESPMKVVGRTVELFPEYVGDARNITAVSAGLGWDNRFRNTIDYSNKFAGVDVRVAYIADYNAGNNPDSDLTDALSLSAATTMGSLWIGAAYERHNAAGLDEEAMRVALKYGMGDLTLVGLYQTSSDENGVSGADRDVMGIGASYAMGNNVLKAQYYQADDLGAGVNTGASMMTIGMDHNLSKTTKAYIVYASTDNDSAASFSVATISPSGHGDTVAAAAAGRDPNSISVGMIFDF